MSKLKEININDKFLYFNKTSCISIHELYLSDLESDDEKLIKSLLEDLFENYGGFRFRFVYCNHLHWSECTTGVRKDYLNNEPLLKHKIFLSIEKDLTLNDIFSLNFNKRAESFIKELGVLNLDKLVKNSFISKETPCLPCLVNNEAIDCDPPFILTDDGSKFGLLKLVAPKDSLITTNLLTNFKLSLPPGSRIVLSITQMNKEDSLTLLKKRSNRSSIKEGLTGAKKKSEIDETLSEIELRSGIICEYDLTVLVPVYDKDESYLHALKQAIGGLGDFEVDKYGAYSSYISSLIGKKPNYKLYESSKSLYPLIPIFTYGNADQDNYEFEVDDIAFKRRDFSIDRFNLFNKEQNANNTLIVGQTGLGKSVFTGLLINSLALNSDNIIKILDVGSSHEETVKKCNGKINALSLDKPSGMNPFKYIHNKSISVEQKSEILSKFIEALILEPKENELKIEEKSLLEDSMLAFINKWHDLKVTKVCSLENFIKEQNTNIPRFNSLKRFSSDGVYHNVFKDSSFITKNMYSDEDEGNVTYFDFKEIAQASDTSFSGAGIAGLVSEFNLSVLSNKSKRKILIIEECKFFIENKFNFLKFAASNIRKYGGAICLVTQNYLDLVPNGDYSLVSQFQNKFFFSLDRVEGNKAVIDLNEKDVSLINSLEFSKGEFSQVFFKSPYSSKVFNVELTPEEYMRLTTDHEDKKLFYKLDELNFNLSKKEKIKLLAGLKTMDKI